MVCGKCASPYMLDDSQGDIRVYKCWVCGNRLYVDYPQRLGSLVCFRCGDAVDTKNELGYCAGCLKLLDIRGEPMKVRTYGETTCACGTTFIKKSPRQLFHTQACRKRPDPPEVKRHSAIGD